MIKDVLILILAGDLLILFYTGAWYDPNKLIEGLELFALWLVLGWAFVNVLRRLMGGERTKPSPRFKKGIIMDGD